MTGKHAAGECAAAGGDGIKEVSTPVKKSGRPWLVGNSNLLSTQKNKQDEVIPHPRAAEVS